MKSMGRIAHRALGAATVLAVSSVMFVAAEGAAQAATGSDIANLATANEGKMACSVNSLGGSGYFSSCTGNGGQPEYWCADFAKWAWTNVGGIATAGLTPAADSFYSYGVNNGTLSDTPELGDAAVFSETNSASNIHHVAIVTGINSNGTVVVENGDYGGQSGTEAQFASTSHVTRATINSTVGTYTSSEGQYLVKYIRPVGVSAVNFGKSDLVRVNADGTLTAWQNNNALAGSWAAPAGIGNAGTTDQTRLKFADLNGDGKDELIRVNDDGSLTAWQNVNGIAGGWGAPVGIGNAGTTDPTRVEFADLNGDGKADLIRVNDDGTLTAWENINGIAGGWAAPVGIGNAGTTDQTRVEFADLNGDGKADLIRVNDDGTLTAWQNSNALADGWAAPVGIGNAGTTDQSRVEFADLNGDGKADLIRVNDDGTLTAWQNSNALADGWAAPVGIGNAGTTDQTSVKFAELG